MTLRSPEFSSISPSEVPPTREPMRDLAVYQALLRQEVTKNAKLCQAVAQLEETVLEATDPLLPRLQVMRAQAAQAARQAEQDFVAYRAHLRGESPQNHP